MNENFELVRADVEAIMDKMFAEYNYAFEEDPEDCSVVYVRLFDVAPEDAQGFKAKIRKNVRDAFEDKGVLLIPSIVTCAETAKYYAQYARRSLSVEDLDECSPLISSIVLQLQKLEKVYPGECCRAEADLPMNWQCSVPCVVGVRKWIDEDGADDKRCAA